MRDFGKLMLLVYFCVAPALFSAQAEALSLKSYVALALKNSPQSALSQSSVDASRASRQSEFSKLLPTVNGSADLSHSETNAGSKVGRTLGIDSSQSASQTSRQNSASVGISAKALVYDFGKTPLLYKATGVALKATEFDMQAGVASIVLNAQTAYFNYLLSTQLLIVNEDALKQANEHLKQAQTLFDVGKQARIAVTNAGVDVANANVNVIHARNIVLLAKVQLETVAAVALSEPLVLSDSLSSAEDTIAYTNAEKKALGSRPEILSAQLKLEAAKIQLQASKASYLPSVNASGNVGFDAQDNAAITDSDWNSSPNWSVGANLSVPIYSGGYIHAAIAQSQAAVMQSKAQLEALTLTVTQQVQQFFVQENDARQRIQATAVVIEQATENLQLTIERYKAGLGTSVDLTDAEHILANARSGHVQALFDYRVAHTNLLLSMGDLTE